MIDLKQITDDIIAVRLTDTAAFATPEPSGKPASAGCIKIQSLVDSVAQRARDGVPRFAYSTKEAYLAAQDAAVEAAVAGKEAEFIDLARQYHAQFIDRLRRELEAPKFTDYVGPAARGDDAALDFIQREMEREEVELVDGVRVTRGVPIVRVSNGIPHGRNGCRRDAITEALRG